MTGIILCGGQSSRMGSDKGLLQQDSFTWTEIAAARFETLGLPFVLSVNEQQLEIYSGKFNSFTIIKDDLSLNVYGPLKGILSAHIQHPNDDLFVLACDMPSMGTEPLTHLTRLSVDKKEEAFAYKNGDHVEPVCAIYTAKGLKKIYDQYAHGNLKKHNLHYVLDGLDTHYEPVPEKWKNYFNNYNSPDDLRTL